jgi:hypothetical protein
MMDHPARNASPLPWIAAALLAASALLMWLPALQTPFWGDDYAFLHAAHATNAAGAPWWSDFWPSSPPRFWRPLSQEGYWRWIDASLGGNAYAAHMVSLALHVLATLGVALFAFRLARACRWSHAGRIAALAGAVYGALTMHLLPVHWAAAANNAMLTLFTTLLLAAWVSARDATHAWRTVLLASLPLWLALALLSKESAALTPALMLVVAAFVVVRRLDRGELLAWLACVAVVAFWLSLRSRFTANTDASYDLSVGSNVVRNAASFVAWLLNVPREAMRMAVAGERMQGLAWIAATALPMLAAWAIAGWRGRTLLTRAQWGCVVLFAGLAYAPYFLFAWNSYEYYAAIAVILPVVVLARCVAVDGFAALAIAALIAVSSWIAVEGTRRLDHPGLIGRAHWAAATLQALEGQPIATPLHVSVADDQRFYAIGQMGLAWRLGIAPEQIQVARECPSSGTCLIIEQDGRWRWRQASE